MPRYCLNSYKLMMKGVKVIGKYFSWDWSIYLIEGRKRRGTVSVLWYAIDKDYYYPRKFRYNWSSCTTWMFSSSEIKVKSIGEYAHTFSPTPAPLIVNITPQRGMRPRGKATEMAREEYEHWPIIDQFTKINLQKGHHWLCCHLCRCIV